ncbi:hypothetical protein [Phenylobacterium sp.]|uniref:hypothetical protein n=1 Tax=Phenylobacterium sp. TaxID=1871053 RepID=UPI00391CC42E
MSRTRRSPAPAEAQPDPRRETPGSYHVQDDGSVARTDEPQRPAAYTPPAAPLESARAIAAALTAAGADVPPHIQAAIDAATTTPPTGQAGEIENKSTSPAGGAGESETE